MVYWNLIDLGAAGAGVGAGVGAGAGAGVGVGAGCAQAGTRRAAIKTKLITKVTQFLFLIFSSYYPSTIGRICKTMDSAINLLNTSFHRISYKRAQIMVYSYSIAVLYSCQAPVHSSNTKKSIPERTLATYPERDSKYSYLRIKSRKIMSGECNSSPFWR
jgi:hypothetical protein